MMKARGRKLKGNKGQTEVARLLQEWWARFEKAKFESTPGSGGWHHSKGFDVGADITCNSPRWPFSVEVKRQEGWSPTRFIGGLASPAWEWWRQTLGDAKATNREPMLFARRNHEPWVVVIRKAYARKLKLLPPMNDLSRIREVDYGGVLPAMYYADDFFLHTPKRFVRSAPRT